jgi:hypothetical protein
MKAFFYQADIYCEDCGEELIADLGGRENCPALVDSNAWPDGAHDEGGGEADHPQHCGACGQFLDNPLTPDGENYVIDAFRDYIDRGAGRLSVLREWRDAYGWCWDHVTEVTVPLWEEDKPLTPAQSKRLLELN